MAALAAARALGEDELLVELFIGELRQGALEGVVLDAMARAAGCRRRTCARPRCTRATSGEVARAALEEGAAGLAALLPAPAVAGLAHAGQPGRRRRGRARAAGPGRVRVQGGRRAHAGPQGGRRGARVHAPPAGRDRRACRRSWSGRARCRPREMVVEGEAIALRPDGRPQPFQVTMQPVRPLKDVEAARPACRCRRSSSTASTSRARVRWWHCRTRSASSARARSSAGAALCRAS